MQEATGIRGLTMGN